MSHQLNEALQERLRLQERLKLVEERIGRLFTQPPEPPDGWVIYFERHWDDNTRRSYRYAGIRCGAGWYISGHKKEIFASWCDFLDWLPTEYWHTIRKWHPQLTTPIMGGV